MPEDIHFMGRAIELAHLTLDCEVGDVGCVVVREDGIEAEVFDEVGLRNDPAAHADVVMLRRAGHAVEPRR